MTGVYKYLDKQVSQGTFAILSLREMLDDSRTVISRRPSEVDIIRRC